jgi:hypothetical protein
VISDKSTGEIEIGFQRIRPEAYEVELRFSDPDPANQALHAPARGQAAIQLAALADLESNPEQYGRLLSEAVFASQSILLQYTRSQAVFSSGFRLRILIAESAPELHNLRWELLRDPISGLSLGTSERILFSRFPASQDWRAINLRPKARLKALVAVAAPSDLDDFDLAPVDAPGETTRATQALAGIEVSILAPPVTLGRLTDALNGIDILYLVCHGAMPPDQEPQLFLENEKGKVGIAFASDLTQRIADMASPPRLAILASCESAGASADNTSRAQSSLAPRLAEAGIPAILAMHGRISMKTIERAMPVFLRELLVDGQIDRALAKARGAVRDRHDHWMPALFLRLKSGRIWYEPGFTGEDSGLKTWPSLCNKIREQAFIPILGPGLGDNLFGGYRKIATQLAEEHHFPGAPDARADLAKVSQYLSIQVDSSFAQSAIERKVAENMAGRPNNANLKDLIDELVPSILANPDDPYKILADLPAKFYIATSPEMTMTRVLLASNKEPETLFGPWRSTETITPSQIKPKKILDPKPATPWVYHVFGAFARPDSLVLTEDDFFDYLIASSKTKLIPFDIAGSITKSSLLLLGFRLDDWTFRVLFRMFMAMEGIQQMQACSHVGVQVDPDSNSLADAKRAREYLRDYFSKNRVAGKPEPTIDVYWGSPTDFLKELRDRLASQQIPISAPVEKEAEDDWDRK